MLTSVPLGELNFQLTGILITDHAESCETAGCIGIIHRGVRSILKSREDMHSIESVAVSTSCSADSHYQPPCSCCSLQQLVAVGLATMAIKYGKHIARVYYNSYKVCGKCSLTLFKSQESLLNEIA